MRMRMWCAVIVAAALIAAAGCGGSDSSSSGTNGSVKPGSDVKAPTKLGNGDRTKPYSPMHSPRPPVREAMRFGNRLEWRLRPLSSVGRAPPW